MMAWRAVLTALVLALLPLTTAAERFERYDGYEIHYNVMPTSRLQPEVARSYGITRSRVQGLLLVSVVKDGVPVPAEVRGSARTDSGQMRDIRFQRIEEGQAIYHLGTYRVTDQEVLRFDLQVRPEMGQQSYPIQFRERFFME
ncbi:MAG: DUF4426 domain-containing protein [Ectothiorhodospiraceae bacterium]|nr:DUF4426 domain-containing protein [Ectothiorhodospiraceae bacterium]